MFDSTDSSAEELVAIDRAPLPSAGAPRPTLIAGRYAVVSQLEGGMALVYLCRDQQTGELVALKTFKPEYMSHRLARDLFLREGTTWVELGSHPHIVRAHRVLRVGDGRQVYLVLEWIVQPQDRRKPSLRTWLYPGRPLSFKAALTFALHIARGMKHATSRIPGLVHRDLKPENVLIGHDGLARVTDFGLASTLSGVNPATLGESGSAGENILRTQLTHGAAGTPLYMAPEQWLKRPLDARADIYALGCILYEMLTGRFAANGAGREQLREVHLAGRIKSPPDSLPREARAFLRYCLATNPANRLRDWDNTVLALEQLYVATVGEPAPDEAEPGDQTREQRIATGESYNSMGLSYLDIGKLPVAVMYFEQAVWIAREEEAPQLEGPALGNLGLAYITMGYVERAIEFYEEHLTIARQLNDKDGEALALGNLGNAYLRLGDVRRAGEFHERQLTLVRRLGAPFKEAAALFGMGEAYRGLGNLSQAESFYKRALAIARKVGDRASIRNVLRSMGHVYLALGQSKEAVSLFHQAMEIAHDNGDRVGEGEALADLAQVYRSQGYRTRAVQLYTRALAIAEESNDSRREIDNLTSLGDLYIEQGDFTGAALHYEAGLAVSQELGDRVREMKAFDGLGCAYQAAGDFMRAAGMHRRAITLARELEDRPALQEALLHLGTAYEKWGDLGRTREYFEQHLQISRQAGDRRAELMILSRLGSVLRRARQLDAARETYEQYLERAREAGDHVAEGDALNKLGNLYRDFGHARQAIDHYKHSLQIAREHKLRLAEAEVLGNLAMAYNELNELGTGWQAARYGEKAVDVAAGTRSNRSLAFALYRLALVLCRQNRWNRALPHAERARNLFLDLGDARLARRLGGILDEIEEKGGRSSGFLG